MVKQMKIDTILEYCIINISRNVFQIMLLSLLLLDDCRPPVNLLSQTEIWDVCEISGHGEENRIYWKDSEAAASICTGIVTVYIGLFYISVRSILHEESTQSIHVHMFQYSNTDEYLCHL